MKQEDGKWQSLRRRSRDLFDKDEVDEVDDIDSRIIKSFKPIKSSTRTLFKSKGGGNELSANDKAYKAVEYAVNQYIKGNKCALGIDDLIRWFGVHYEWLMGKPCIDYNHWNTLYTFRNLQSSIGVSEQELGYFISKWLFTYRDLGYEGYLKEQFSISTLKRAWIVSALFNDIPASKSRKSYY